MFRKRLQSSEGSQGPSLKKRCKVQDLVKAKDILVMLEDELAVLDKVMYTQRNQHRNCIYYRAMKKVCLLFDLLFYS